MTMTNLLLWLSHVKGAPTLLFMLSELTHFECQVWMACQV